MPEIPFGFKVRACLLLASLRNHRRLPDVRFSAIRTPSGALRWALTRGCGDRASTVPHLAVHLDPFGPLFSNDLEPGEMSGPECRRDGDISSVPAARDHNTTDSRPVMSRI